MQSCSHICPIERKQQLLRVPLLESKPRSITAALRPKHSFSQDSEKNKRPLYLLTLLPEFQLAHRDDYWYHPSLQTLQEKMI